MPDRPTIEEVLAQLERLRKELVAQLCTMRLSDPCYAITVQNIHRTKRRIFELQQELLCVEKQASAND